MIFFKDAYAVLVRDFRISRAWNINLKMSIQDNRTRLHDLTGLEHYFEDAYTILGRDFRISLGNTRGGNT